MSGDVSKGRDHMACMSPLPLSVSVADQANRSGHALPPEAELRGLLESPDTHCRSGSTFFLHPGQTVLINHGTYACSPMLHPRQTSLID